MAITTTSMPTIADVRAELHSAAAAKERAWALVTETESMTRQLHRTLRPDDEAPSASRREVLRAHIELAKLHDALDERRLAAEEADVREQAARAAVQEAIAAEVNGRRRQVVTRLAKHLLAARIEADALSKLQDESPFPDQILWPTVQSRTQYFESQLDAWLLAVRSYGLLID